MENSKLELQDACSQWPASSRWSLHALEERQSYKSMYESVNIFACVCHTHCAAGFGISTSKWGPGFSSQQVLYFSVFCVFTAPVSREYWILF